jgi:chaperonin GroEL
VRHALQAPARQIVENAGGGAAAVIPGKQMEQADANQGYDARRGTFTSMGEGGITDPTKVVRLALQGAASVASRLITTEAMVAERPERHPAPAISAGGMGTGGMEFEKMDV